MPYWISKGKSLASLDSFGVGQGGQSNQTDGEFYEPYEQSIIIFIKFFLKLKRIILIYF